MKSRILLLIFILLHLWSFSEEEFIQEDLKVGIGRLDSDVIYVKGETGGIVLTYIQNGEPIEDYFEVGKVARLVHKDKNIYYNDKIVEEVYAYKESPSALIYLSKDNKTYYPYRGDFYFTLYLNDILPINLIQSEEYLYSVVPSEIGSNFPDEAIKAQAVAARTYLYYNLKNSKYCIFDLLDDTSSQVYLGYSKENEKIRKFVDDTKGEVITYDGIPINALYHSTSGGYTANNEDVWGGKSIPYLRAIDDSGNGKESPRDSWTYRVSLEKISKEFGFKVSDIRVVQRKNNRVTKVEVIGEKRLLISGNNLRKRLGYTKIFSTMFEVSKRESQLVFKGSGSGHGVGMSQWGAYTLSKNGKKYQDILKHYYKNVEIKSLKKSENML